MSWWRRREKSSAPSLTSIRRPSSACSERRIAPRTEVSASSFWGGSLPEVSGGTEMATATQATRLPGAVPTSASRHDGLDLRSDALVDLDRDHVRSSRPDRLIEL